MDCIFGDVDLAAIERASISGRGILNLVKVLKDAIKHMRKDFAALCGDAHWLQPRSQLPELVRQT